MHHLERPHLVSVADHLVDQAGRVLAEPHSQSELEVIDAQRMRRLERYRLSLALTRDDVRLPFVTVDGCTALSPERRGSTEVGAVSVGQHDAFQVRGRMAQSPYLFQHAMAVGIKEGIDEGQLGAGVKEKRVY